MQSLAGASKAKLFSSSYSLTQADMLGPRLCACFA
jgi:hypothetical protein